MVYYILCQHLQLCQNLRLEQRGWGIWSPPSCTTGAWPGLLSGVFWKCLLIHFCHSSGFHQGLAFILMLLSSYNPRSSNKELIILYLPLNIQKSEVYLADFFITKTLFSCCCGWKWVTFCQCLEPEDRALCLHQQLIHMGQIAPE